jgi:hypothetical protein
MKKILIAFMGICFLFCPTLAGAWTMIMAASAEVEKPCRLFALFYLEPGPPEIDIDWGDGTTTGWIQTHCQGQPIDPPPYPTCLLQLEHTWVEPGTYFIKARGRNNLVETDWSDFLLAVVVLLDPQPPPVRPR